MPHVTDSYTFSGPLCIASILNWAMIFSALYKVVSNTGIDHFMLRPAHSKVIDPTSDATRSRFARFELLTISADTQK